MINSRFLLPVIFFAFVCGCAADKVPHDEQFTAMASKGKAVFEERECGKCHYTGDEEVSSDAPDLLNPFMAGDSLFVSAHLKFLDESTMPALAMSDEEIRAVSHYVAQLHAARQPRISPKKADARCPVCRAAVSTETAAAKKLVYKYLGKYHYFECEACLKTFKSAPEAFIGR